MSKPAHLEHVHAQDGDTSALRDAVARYLRQLDDCDLIGGRLLKNVDIDSAPGTALEHGLGRTPEGWIVTDLRGGATVWRTAWDAKFLTLEALAPVVASVWVY